MAPPRKLQGIEPFNGAEPPLPLIHIRDRLDTVEWLVENGVPRPSAEKASAHSIQTAYANERYLRGWITKETERRRISSAPINQADLMPKPSKFSSKLFSDEEDEGAVSAWTELKQQEKYAQPIVTPPASVQNYFDLQKMINDALSGLSSVRNELADKSDILNKSISELWADVNTLIETTASLKAHTASLNAQIDKKIEESWIKSFATAAPRRDPAFEASDEAAFEASDEASSSEIDPDFFISPDISRPIRIGITQGLNIMLHGPTGCGKTETVAQIAHRLSHPFIRINMRGDVTSSTFLGRLKIDLGDKFLYGALPRAMQSGSILLIDEIDYTPPHIAAVLNPVLERHGKLFIPETGETIDPAPGFSVIATANSGGKGDATGIYTGVEVLNTAFLDRFAINLKMDYLPDVIERGMLEKRFPKILPSQIADAVALATEIRAAFKNSQLTTTLSTRKLIDLFTLVSQGFTIEKALDLVLLNWLDDDDLNLVKTFVDRIGFSVGEPPPWARPTA